MFPIDEAAVWERRDAVLLAQQANAAAYPTIEWPETTIALAQAAVASSDDVPKLLDALVQVYGELVSERHAIDETMDATDNKLAAVVWARVQSEHAAATHGFGKVRHHG
jgi:hypothetical protein